MTSYLRSPEFRYVKISEFWKSQFEVRRWRSGSSVGVRRRSGQWGVFLSLFIDSYRFSLSLSLSLSLWKKSGNLSYAPRIWYQEFLSNSNNFGLGSWDILFNCISTFVGYLMPSHPCWRTKAVISNPLLGKIRGFLPFQRVLVRKWM